MKPTLLIMAAGMGNRYGGLKQLDSVGPSGETIMDYSVYNALKAGFGKIVFVIRRCFEQDFCDKILSKYEELIPCRVVFQEIDKLPTPFKAPEGRERPWGTNHALMMAEEVIKEPFCVINADDFYGKEAFQLMARALKNLPEGSKNKYFIVSYTLGKTLSESGSVSRGICQVDEAQQLLGVKEYRKLRPVEGSCEIRDEETNTLFPFDTPVSMNFWGFTLDYFAYSEMLFREFLRDNGSEDKSEFYIPSVVERLIRERKTSLEVMQTTDSWFGITYAEDRPTVVALLGSLHEQGAYPTPLFSN